MIIAPQGDYDDDGDVDLYVVNRSNRSVLYRNDGTSQPFVDVGTESGTANLAQGSGSAFGDYDSDGDIDIYLLNEEGPNRLYENGGSTGNWLQLKVSGTLSNTDGVGARLRAFAGERVWTRSVNGTAGFSQSSRVVQFGLGDLEGLDSLLVHWPSGNVETHRNLAAGTTQNLIEGGGLTGVEQIQGAVPTEFFLEQNYPNPFNGDTVIRFGVARSGPVELVLFNVLGQRVRTLADGERTPGRYQVTWDGLNDHGQAVASGLYFYRLSTERENRVRRLVLLR